MPKIYEIERTINRRTIIVKKFLMSIDAFNFLENQDYDHYALYERDTDKGSRRKIVQKLKNGKLKDLIKHNHKEIDIYIHLNTELEGEVFRNRDDVKADFYIKDYFPNTGLFMLVIPGNDKKEKSNRLWYDIKNNMPKLYIKNILKGKTENEIWVVPRLKTHFSK